MNKFMTTASMMMISHVDLEAAQCEEFKRRAELARTTYWDACKYPRKTKKRIRKEAIQEYNFYIQLSKPINFDWTL